MNAVLPCRRLILAVPGKPGADPLARIIGGRLRQLDSQS